MSTKKSKRGNATAQSPRAAADTANSSASGAAAIQVPRVAVIVATYNRTESLTRVLTELAAQTFGQAEYEVVVVDDGSRESMQAVAAAFADRLTLQFIRQPNGGAAAARQAGAERALAPLVIFVDDDMRTSLRSTLRRTCVRARTPRVLSRTRRG
jgi:cellulose synthase/poly-beta-1,6-N-acetylglucosamine synthase-like glycosyltransferase